MSDRALRRLSCCLLTPVLLAASAADAQGQDSTQTGTVQQRTQPIELQQITGVLIQSNKATPRAGFEFVKLSDGKVVVKRFGAGTGENNSAANAAATTHVDVVTSELLPTIGGTL